MFSASTFSIIADEYTIKGTEVIIQDVLDSNKMDITATQKSQEEYQKIWNIGFVEHDGVKKLLEVLKNDLGKNVILVSDAESLSW